jgi:hypothetical protein
MKHSACIVFFCMLITSCNLAKSQSIWGRLANPGFENHYIKSTFFFAGNWRNGTQFYEFNPSDNTGLYTIHPSDFRHLGWSETLSYRNFAVNTMINAGVNMINMSYWGPRGTDNWAFWAPMQTSTWAHDELFDVAVGKDILVAPYIESFSPTDLSEGYTLRDCFPGDSLNPAPQLVAMIEDLVDRYLINPDNESWPGVWARAYDQDGTERCIVSLIHVASSQADVTGKNFASGFDWVADKVFDNTGVRVGFLLDALPEATYSPGDYKITPEAAERWLAMHKSILGIQCFIPEIWTGYDNDADLIAWKKNYSEQWANTSIPFIIDVSPGYDAHIVFAESMIYGNNEAWRDSLTAIVEDIPAEGISVNTWNGYTEGFAVVPSLEFGDAGFSWITSLFEMYTIPDTINGFEETLPISKEFIVYPNPAENELHIQTDNLYDGTISCEIYSLQGERLVTEEIQSCSCIDIGNLAKGIYLLQLSLKGSRSRCYKVIRE